MRFTKDNSDPRPMEVWNAKVDFDGSDGAKNRPVIVLEKGNAGYVVFMVTSHGHHPETDIKLVDPYEVMLDKSSLPYEQNRDEVAAVVKVAHAVGVGVEAELGHVGTGDKYDQEGDTVFTRPDEAVQFLEESGADTLAVSVGRKDGKPEIALPLEGGVDRIYPVGKIEVK